MINKKSLKSIIEAILFVSENPLTPTEILKIVSEVETSPSDSSEALQSTRLDIQKALEEIKNSYQDPNYGFELVNVAEGFQFRTKVDFSPYVKAMNQVSPMRLSQASLETLSMVAYRQPITRAEIDQMRGVDSGGVLKTLLDRELIRIVGKKEEPGKPLLYGTTNHFLETFSLKNLQDLPTLKDLKQIEEEIHQQNLSRENNISLDQEFFKETESSNSIELPVASFADLPSDEEETLQELEEKIDLVNSVEKEILNSISSEPETIEKSS